MIFQNRCQIKISPEDARLAREALCTPDMIDPETDLVIGEADVWDGSKLEARLCGIPGEPAFMAVAAFRGEKLLGFTRSDTYQTVFELSVGEFEYLITLYEGKPLDREAPSSATKGKTPARSKHSQKER